MRVREETTHALLTSTSRRDSLLEEAVPGQFERPQKPTGVRNGPEERFCGHTNSFQLGQVDRKKVNIVLSCFLLQLLDCVVGLLRLADRHIDFCAFDEEF